MILPEARVGPYVRALAAALHTVAPNVDYPPLPEMLAHLRALDPALCGGLLDPAEVDERTGMPAFTWLERARAEQRIARERPSTTTDADLERAGRLDAALAARLRWRRDLHRHLREHDVLPSSRVDARARRLGRATEVLVFYDRIAPDGTWGRIALVLAAPAGARDLGCARVGPQGRIELDPGLLHLLTRHAPTALLALRAQIAAVTDGTVRRVVRATVGPFWFPGVLVPERVPDALGRGLLLHLGLEVVGDDVHHSVDRDPLGTDLELAPPPGFGILRDRRFACTAPLVAPLRAWSRANGIDPEIVAFG